MDPSRNSTNFGSVIKQLLVVLSLVLTTRSSGQYDIGLSAGVFDFEFLVAYSASHNRVGFSDLQEPGYSASVFYRERGAKRVQLGLSLDYSRRSFHTYYAGGGLGSAYGADVDVTLDLFHLSIVPEMYIDPARNVTFRFGLQLGVGSIARVTGNSWEWGPNAAGSKVLANSRSYDFNSDMRVLLGFGIRVPLQSKISICLDPYASAGITSIVAQSPRNHCMEWGVRLGVSLTSPRDGFWAKRRQRRALRKKADASEKGSYEARMPIALAMPN